MKKITLLLASLATFAFGESTIYVGGGALYNDTTTKFSGITEELTQSEESFKFKVGYGDREAYAVELSTEYINSDPNKYAFDISLIKAFDFNIYVNPFAKVGFGGGIVDNRDTQNKSLTFGSFNFGGGVFVPFNEDIDVELAYEFKNRSYQRVNETDPNESRTSNVHALYLGANYRF